jgi:hypothetical protein
MTASFDKWKPYENYVQSGGEGPGMVDGRYVSGTFVGVFAGPPRLSTVGGALGVGSAITTPGQASQIVYPIGITQNFNISQNRNFSRIFELGSERSYHISGRTMGQIGLGRVLYHGPSVLRTLYAYYQDLLPPTLVPSVFSNVGSGAMPNPHDVQLAPGYENFYINLASDLFSQPIGLLVVVKDSNLDTYGAFYVESCFVPSHSFATDSQGVVVQEQVSLQYEMLVPIATKSIELIT